MIKLKLVKEVAMIYETQLRDYLENRLAKNRQAVQRVTGGDRTLLRCLQLGWVTDFYKKRCEELDRVVTGLEDVIEGKDGEIANLNDLAERNEG
jgi:hypothetical protein